MDGADDKTGGRPAARLRGSERAAEGAAQQQREVGATQRQAIRHGYKPASLKSASAPPHARAQDSFCDPRISVARGQARVSSLRRRLLDIGPKGERSAPLRHTATE